MLIKYKLILRSHLNFFFIKSFHVGITMHLDISVKLIHQVITIICHHMKKNIIKKKKIQKYGRLDQNSYVNKKDFILITFIITYLNIYYFK